MRNSGNWVQTRIIPNIFHVTCTAPRARDGANAQSPDRLSVPVDGGGREQNDGCEFVDADSRGRGSQRDRSHLANPVDASGLQRRRGGLRRPGGGRQNAREEVRPGDLGLDMEPMSGYGLLKKIRIDGTEIR